MCLRSDSPLISGSSFRFYLISLGEETHSITVSERRGGGEGGKRGRERKGEGEKGGEREGGRRRGGEREKGEGEKGGEGEGGRENHPKYTSPHQQDDNSRVKDW